MKKHFFDTNKYQLQPLLCNLFEIEDLSLIHTKPSLLKSDVSDTPSKDQKDKTHQLFYKYCGNQSYFHTIYQNLIKEVISPIFNETLIYQTIPTFRCHQPNNLAVSQYHRDRDYFHFKEEINFFMPFTKAFDSNSIWIESQENKEDYLPIMAQYGELVEFDGANLKHGNKLNTTGKTRISIDFRVMPYKYYYDRDISSIATGTEMKLGSYYSLLE